MKPTVAVLAGTRPEMIKLAPVVKAMAASFKARSS